MAVFACILTDHCVAVNDMLRIWVDRISLTPNESPINMVEIDPDGSGTFYDVMNDLIIDWQYDTSGTYTIELRVTLDDGSIKTFLETIEVKEDECFFSDDDCLRKLEPRILECLECYRCSFKYVHRQIVECLMECLREEGLLSNGCEPIDVLNLKNSTNLKKVATYWALENIYMEASKLPDDFYERRAKYYSGLRKSAFNKSKLYYDKDGDGVIEPGEYVARSNRIIFR